MSLSGALSNAMSGLTANARGTSIVSANIANALNENYSKRTVHLGTDANQSSGGVTVTSVSRYNNSILAHETRLAAAEHSQSNVRAEAASEVERLWGSVDTLGSVADKLTKFEVALYSAASDPSSETRLRGVAQSAEAFAAAIRSASDGVQNLRTRSDQAIAASVEQMNSGLQRLESLNEKIVLARHLSQNTLSLSDNRDRELNRLAEFVPLHVVERESGEIAVFTAKGRTLLDGARVELSFEEQPLIQPHMSLQNGLLSGLLVDGQPVDASENGMFQGGLLAAHFEVRDETTVATQARLDGVARDVVDRFGPSGPDSTLLPGDAGVFTDAGAAFSLSDEQGLSARFELNSVLQPASSEIWRWRDGLAALSKGEVGNASLLLSLNDQISTNLTPNSIALGSTARNLTDHVLGFSEDVAAVRVTLQDASEFAASRFDDLKLAAASEGVNTDQELQHLIELEKAYAANARVVRVVDDMLTELLRI